VQISGYIRTDFVAVRNEVVEIASEALDEISA